MANLNVLPRRIDREWFDVHQQELVQLANEWWVRAYLHLEPLPVTALWPGAVSYALPDGQTRSVFTSRPRVAKRIAQLARWERTHGLLGTKLIASDPKLAMVELAAATTSTFHPEPHIETVSVDGRVDRTVAQQGESWATIRAGAGTTASDSTASQAAAGHACSSVTSNQYIAIYRGIFLFDSSNISDTDVISSATFSLLGSAGSLDGGNQNVAVVASTPASNTALAASDYGQLGSVRLADTDVDLSAWSIIAYNDWVLNATGIAAISKTGISKFGLRISGDLDNSAPTWSANNASEVQTIFADTADTTSDPKLVVIHAQPAGKASAPNGPSRLSPITRWRVF